MRPLLLYMRSRHVPMAVAAAVGTVATLWALDRATDHRAPDLLGLLAVLTATVAAGPGLAGPDVDLDRTAAIAWPCPQSPHRLPSPQASWV